MDNEAKFRNIFAANKWAGSESVSGPGSGTKVTEPVRRALPILTQAFGVRSLLDAPCGDFNWMQHVELGVEQYVGVDVVPELVEMASAFATPDREFRVADIAVDELPSVDMIHCRDLLVHMSNELARSTIANFKASGSRLLLTTTFYAVTHNAPGSTGGWRPINLQIAPFDFPAPILIVPERRFSQGQYSDKSLGLWQMADLPG